MERSTPFSMEDAISSSMHASLDDSAMAAGFTVAVALADDTMMVAAIHSHKHHHHKGRAHKHSSGSGRGSGRFVDVVCCIGVLSTPLTCIDAFEVVWKPSGVVVVLWCIWLKHGTRRPTIQCTVCLQVENHAEKARDRAAQA